MARDLRLNIDGSSGGADRALEEVAAAADLAAHEADRMAAQFRQATNDAQKLDRQLAQTAIETRALARELAKNPADATIKAQLAAQKKASSELKGLRQDVVGDTEKAAKDANRFAERAVKDLAKARKEAENTASRLSEIGSEFGQLGSGAASAVSGGLTSPAGLGLAGALAVPAVAGVGGAVTAAAGIGAVGLGVTGAILGDPAKFGAAWSVQTSHLKQSLIDASKPFEGPLLDAIRSVGPLVDSWHIDKTLATASTFVQPLVSGIEGFATEIAGGVDALVQHGGPVFRELAETLPQLGSAIADGLSAIADNAQGGAQALGDIIQLIGGITDGLLHVVAGAEHVYSVFKEMDKEASDFIRSHQGRLAVITSGLSNVGLAVSDAFSTDELAHFGHALEGVTLTGSLAADQAAIDAAQYDKLAAQLGVTALKANSLADGANKIFQQLLAADHATLSWDESLTKLGESFKTNGKSIDEHTAKGQANREAVLSAIASNAQLYVSNIEQGKGVTFATDAYDKNERALETSLRQAGLNQQAIDGLVGKYRSVPDTVKTDIQMKGLTDAINGLDDVLRRINHLPPRKQVNIDVVVGGQIGLAEALLGAGIIGSLSPKHKAMGGIRHAAAGMIVPPSNPGTLVVGEPQTGGEAFIPLGSSISDSGAMALAGVVGAAHGFAVGPRVPAGLFGRRGGSDGAIAVTIDFSGAVDTAMGSAFAKLLRTGDVQIKASQIRP